MTEKYGDTFGVRVLAKHAEKEKVEKTKKNKAEKPAKQATASKQKKNTELCV